MRSGAPAVHGNSYENTFSAVISSPYLHLLAGLDRRKRIFIRYGEPQAHGNSVVNKDQRGIRWTFGALTSATTRSPGWSANSSHACLVSKADSRKPQSRPIRIIGPSLVTERTVAGR